MTFIYWLSWGISRLAIHIARFCQKLDANAFVSSNCTCGYDRRFRSYDSGKPWLTFWRMKCKMPKKKGLTKNVTSRFRKLGKWIAIPLPPWAISPGYKIYRVYDLKYYRASLCWKEKRRRKTGPNWEIEY